MIAVRHHHPLTPHPLGLSRPGEVTHMCPECGEPPAPFCALCLGAGHITTDRLARYQHQILADAGMA